MILPIRLCRLGYQCLEDLHVNLRRTYLSFDEATFSNVQLEDNLKLAMEWLRLSHQMTGFEGSSKAFTFLSGWRDAYPETTGYIAETFFEYATFSSKEIHIDEGMKMLDFLCKIQEEDGGIRGGTLDKTRSNVSIIFNTGMVMAGWLKGYEVSKNNKYLDSLIKAGNFLVRIRSDQNLWLKHSYNNILHTYHSRVAWVLLNLYSVTNEPNYKEAAVDIYEWVLSQQLDNGYFKNCLFSPKRQTSNTHGIAYTLRGLVEGFLIMKDDKYINAVTKTSNALLEHYEKHRFLPTLFNEEWKSESKSECLTGIAQLSIIWFKVYQITNDIRYLRTALNTTDLLCTLQNTRSIFKEIRGGVKGSHPIWGGYAPFQYPNWATKFFADSLMLRLVIMSNLKEKAVPRL